MSYTGFRRAVLIFRECLVCVDFARLARVRSHTVQQRSGTSGQSGYLGARARDADRTPRARACIHIFKRDTDSSGQRDQVTSSARRGTHRTHAALERVTRARSHSSSKYAAHIIQPGTRHAPRCQHSSLLHITTGRSARALAGLHAACTTRLVSSLRRPSSACARARVSDARRAREKATNTTAGRRLLARAPKFPLLSSCWSTCSAREAAARPFPDGETRESPDLRREIDGIRVVDKG